MKVGDKAPDVEVVTAFPDTSVKFSELVAGKKVPNYLGAQDALKAAGIDSVLVYCVNDMAVMGAWAKSLNVEGSMISMFADPTSTLTKALGVELSHPGPAKVLGSGRCKRFAMYFDSGVCKAVAISETPDDPTGDGEPSASMPENMIKLVTSA